MSFEISGKWVLPTEYESKKDDQDQKERSE